MNEQPPYLGSMPGVTAAPLTRDPLGTSGELSPGPDHLRPEVPEERRELERMGYLPDKEDVDELADFGVMDDSGQGSTTMDPLFESPPAFKGPIGQEIAFDGPLFD